MPCVIVVNYGLILVILAYGVPKTLVVFSMYHRALKGNIGCSDLACGWGELPPFGT